MADPLDPTPETNAQRVRRLAHEKANDQLRENRRTASHKLERLITYSLLVETGRNTCCRCGCGLTASTFSIDHMENWLDSADPRGLFFDLKNIDFSCKTCNSSFNRGKFGTRNNPEALKQLATGWKARKPLLADAETFGGPDLPQPPKPTFSFKKWFRNVFRKGTSHDDRTDVRRAAEQGADTMEEKVRFSASKN